MWTSIKQLRSYVKSVAGSISIKPSYSEKPQDYLRVNRNPPISQSQSLPADPVDTSTEISYQKNFPRWTRDSYSGLHTYNENEWDR
jgi:hypothetical protein